MNEESSSGEKNSSMAREIRSAGLQQGGEIARGRNFEEAKEREKAVRARGNGRRKKESINECRFHGSFFDTSLSLTPSRSLAFSLSPLSLSPRLPRACNLKARCAPGGHNRSFITDIQRAEAKKTPQQKDCNEGAGFCGEREVYLHIKRRGEGGID